jgi:hypothetical protein
MALLAPVSWGELIDKITILEIKSSRIADAGKRANVARELAALTEARDLALPAPPPGLNSAVGELRAVNETLWRIEDEIRECEKRGDFSATFVALARSIYATNDRRAAIKRRINAMLGSDLVEEKSYKG